MMRATGFSKDDSQGFPDSEMSEPLNGQMFEQLTFYVEDSPVRMCQWPENARAWLESDHPFGSSFLELYECFIRGGLLSRIRPACYPVMQGETLPQSFEGWSNAGMACAGGYLMLNTSEWPSAGAVCSLSAVLETEVAPRYFLSPRAAAGILHRAAKRGRKLPRVLRLALESLAMRLDEGK